MAPGLDEGYAFELGNLWRQSKIDPGDGNGGLFHTPDFSLPDLEEDDENATSVRDSLFDLPTLLEVNNGDCGSLEDLKELVKPADSADVRTSSDNEQHLLENVWDLDLGGLEGPKVQELRTWESFTKASVSFSAHTVYFSEAGSAAFDAAIASTDRSAAGSLPQDVVLHALGSLALGRSSIFFRWDETQHMFLRTLEHLPVAGYSPSVTNSLVSCIADYGSIYRSLRAYADSAGSLRHHSPTGVAFKSIISSILEAIETDLMQRLPRVRSVLQIQTTLSRPHNLLDLLQSLKVLIQQAETEEESISLLSDRISALAEAGNLHTPLLRELLVAVCTPWLLKMAEDVGIMQPSLARLVDREDIDERPVFDMSTDTAAATQEARGTLLSGSDRSLVKETRATLKILREHCADLVPASEAAVSNTASFLLRQFAACDDQASRASHQCNEMWTFDDGLQDDDSSSDLTATLYDRTKHHAAIYTADAGFLIDGSPPDEMVFELDGSADLSPFAKLRPAILAQSLHLNKSLLQYLFRDCCIRQHLSLQRGFHLLGSGDFVTRLSTALFSEEAQTAERKRGIVPTAETMGLRLGVKEGQRWPPASSELQLTLAGVLSDAYHHIRSVSTTHKQQDLPGSLSFAIRELPDNEIDRVMDASSIYALDFLRLQYTPPAPLDAILTPAAMQRYDDIFRFALRMLRLLDVTKKFRRSVRGRSADASFATVTHHIVSVLMCHFMDVGIMAPWVGLEQQLLEVHHGLDSKDKAMTGLHSLCEMHIACLDKIRGRLFLKRKQYAIRTAIEHVQSAVLKAAATHNQATQAPSAFADAASQCSTAIVKLVDLLQAIVDKPPKSTSRSEDDDVDATALLLTKLDWNGRYTISLQK